MAPFRFGKHEIKYALYGLIIAIPIMLDDIAESLPLSEFIKTGMMIAIFLCALVIFRFKFIFPAIAISHNTNFMISWQKSKAYWGSMIISFLQLLIIMIPVTAVLSLIGFGLFVLVWVFGFVSIENWTIHNGFNVLFKYNPAILGIYLFLKESIWILLQAVFLIIVGLYYRDASLKIVSDKS
jgi:hypothetical protein